MEIEKARRAIPSFRHVLFQPEQLGRFHLGGDHATDVTQNSMLGFIDRFRLRDRAMIHPHDHVLRIAIAWRNRHRLIVGIETDE